jgi:hypothetical protein
MAASCSQTDAVEYTVDGKTVVRTWVRNEDGSYTYKYMLQDSADLEAFRVSVRDMIAAKQTYRNWVAALAGTGLTAVTACAASVATAVAAPVVCGAGVVATGVVGGLTWLAWREYQDALKETRIAHARMKSPVYSFTLPGH